VNAGAVTLEDLSAAVERLERKIDALGRRRDRRLLSKRAAARLLGVDRGTTLERLIREGTLRAENGRIPLADLERILDPREWQKQDKVKADKAARDRANAVRKERGGGLACEVCGWRLPPPRARHGVHLHHIRPRRSGGGEGRANLVALCPNHHALAHAIFGRRDPGSREALIEAIREAEQA